MTQENYKSAITEILANDKIWFYWKGRVALFALLKSMKVREKDEVILPGYTCVVVPNAVKYLHAKPVYVDAEKSTMNTTLDRIKGAITDKTKVIIVQNTFGLSSEVDVIASFARGKHIYTIEDCTHGFGGTFKGKPNGSWCDSAFYSTQWNKPFSTGIGGFCAVNNHEIIPQLEKINKELSNPSVKDQIVLSVLLFAADNFLDSKNYWRLRSIYRFLSKYNLVIGSSQGSELNSTEMPADYFKGISKVQIKKGVANLKSFVNVMNKRKKNAILYSEFLKGYFKYHVSKDLFCDHSFLKYPILVKDRKKFDELAIKAKIKLGDWFCSPIYPVKENWEKWDLNATTIPNAVYLSQHIENLSTETDNPEAVLKFLMQNIDELI
jgi:perosamine synthetase